MAIGPNVVDDCEGMTEEDYWRGMDEAMQDEEGDEPFCNCSAGHSIEETDWNQCDSCGKPIYDEEPAVSPAPTFCRWDDCRMTTGGFWNDQRPEDVTPGDNQRRTRLYQRHVRLIEYVSRPTAEGTTNACMAEANFRPEQRPGL